MIVTVRSLAGKRKNQSDDTVVINHHLINNGTYDDSLDRISIVGVADGVGGNAGGKQASEYVSARLSEYRGNILDEDEIRTLFTHINTGLLDYANSHKGAESMATTFSGLISSGEEMYLVHIGNTRIYKLQGVYLRQLTIDHTMLELISRQYGYDEAARINKNEIYACLGGGKADFCKALMVRKIKEKPFSGTFLMTSDGIHDHISIGEMEEIMRTFSDDHGRAKALQQAALKNGSEDDMSIVVIRG